MKNSAIQWTDHTFNPWEGCTKVAPECKNCYAETLVDKRFGRAKWGKGRPRRRTSEATWRQPLRWNREAEEQLRYHLSAPASTYYQRPRVFCLSLGDWLDEEVPVQWRADLFALIKKCGNLDWQLLTKRPQNWRMLVEEVGHYWAEFGAPDDETETWLEDWLGCHGDCCAPSNIWIGVSAGADQKAALEIPAKVHFLSCEPMLHALDEEQNHVTQKFDWIIFGGESGKNARPCNIDWIRRGVEMCRFYDIAPFVKQLGARPLWNHVVPGCSVREALEPLDLKDSHGGDMSEWPEDLRVREFPEASSVPSGNENHLAAPVNPKSVLSTRGSAA